jgi:hypothetical protein
MRTPGKQRWPRPTARSPARGICDRGNRTHTRCVVHPAITLEGKLAKFASFSGVPVRFVPAQELAYLRQNLSGTLPPKLLLDSIISAGPILAREWSQGVIDSTKKNEQIFDMAVQHIFGEAPTRSSWHQQTRDLPNDTD